MSSHVCPACQSAQVMRQRMVHDAGTATVTSTTVGVGGAVGAGGSRPGVFAASSSGQQQSNLAKRCAPPERGPTTGLIIAAIVILILAFCIAGSDITFRWGTFIVGAVIAGIVALAAVGSYRENRTAYPAKLAEYERRWICMTCGHVWTPPESTAGGASS